MIDLEKLLSPIADEAPTGPDLRLLPEDITFARIEDLRREVDAAIDDAGGKAANWPAVRRESEQALATVSKDLVLAGWLAEALGHLEGFEGLRDGLRLIRGLLERFWGEVHPRAEVDGEHELLTARARCLNWLSARRGLLPSIGAIGLLGADDRREQWLSWAAYLEAQRLEDASLTNPARHEEMIASGSVTMERWNAALAATPLARLHEEFVALTACESELQALDEVCQERFPADDAPSFVELRGLLTDIREWLGARLPDGRGEGESKAEHVSAPRDAVGAAATGPIGSREQALIRLREVADFFRRTEPHSPVSHLVDRAVRWGGMSFEELLLDVVKNNDALSQIWETLGIKPPSAGE